MPSVPGQLATAEREESVARSLIPDLCAARSVVLMVLLVELLVLVHCLASSRLPQFRWELLGNISLFGQWVVLLSAALLCRLRGYFATLSLPLVTCASLLVVLLVTAGSSYLGWRLFPALQGEVEEAWWLARNLLVATVLTGIVLRYFYLQQRLLLQEQLETRARLDSLRARIRPHFLFNTLNSVASLIQSRPREAERAVEDLSELFRASLQDHGQTTTVEDELRLCELYLDIERLRLGDRLEVDWQVDPALRRQAMASLLLQPLVENAVYHGVARLPAGGRIEVGVHSDGDRVRVTVDNPVPAAPEPAPGLRMALSNIEQRLQALYGSRAAIHTSRNGERYRVELSYPREAET